MSGQTAAAGATLAETARRANLRCSTVEEAVTAALREAIITGVLKPGERLRQAALAKELNTSRVPVAAALHNLAAEGLVDYAPHRGAAVRVLEPEELEETYQLRIVLETFACGWPSNGSPPPTWTNSPAWRSRSTERTTPAGGGSSPTGSSRYFIKQSANLGEGR